MCCFSRPVKAVRGTEIFAGELPGGMQSLVYQMEFEAAGDLAMILPLPVPAGPEEDAVDFVDLQGYPDFFGDLKKAFPVPVPAAPPQLRAAPGAPKRQALAVHRVGDFEASFVPTLADFGRLDERFKLPPATWSAVPGYGDWGFAVFKLRAPPAGPEGSARRVHPMALRFPRRDADALFFPTLHVHDGALHALAAFEHTLYCQPRPELAATLGWFRSPRPLGDSVEAARAKGVLDGRAHGFTRRAVGTFENRDVVLRPLPGIGDARQLHVVREAFTLTLRVAAAHRPVFAPGEHAAAEGVRAAAPALIARLPGDLDALLASRREAWGLRRGDDGLPLCTWDGAQLVSPGPPGSSPAPAGPVRVALALAVPPLEPQGVTLAFDRAPAPEALRAVQAELTQCLARCVAA